MIPPCRHKINARTVPATGFEPVQSLRTIDDESIASTEVFLSTTPFNNFRSNRRNEKRGAVKLRICTSSCIATGPLPL